MDTPPSLSARTVLGQLYDTHAAALAAYAVSLGLSRAAAEDCLHAVFLDYYHMLLRGADIRNSRGYLYQAVRNHIHGQRRADAKRGELSLQQACLATRSPAGVSPETASADALYRAVQRLPAEQREVIELKYFHQLTYQDIADLTGVSPNTAMSRGRLALQRLAQLLKEQS